MDDNTILADARFTAIGTVTVQQYVLPLKPQSLLVAQYNDVLGGNKKESKLRWGWR